MEEQNNNENHSLLYNKPRRSLLTFDEATDLSLKVKWKTILCNSGEECWCRIITPEIDIEDKDGNEIYIAGSGAIPKIYAEHIVKLHNDFITYNNLSGITNK